MIHLHPISDREGLFEGEEEVSTSSSPLLLFPYAIICKIGSRKANVFPLPVSLCMPVLLVEDDGDNIARIAFDWIIVGRSKLNELVVDFTTLSDLPLTVCTNRGCNPNDSHELL